MIYLPFIDGLSGQSILHTFWAAQPPGQGLVACHPWANRGEAGLKLVKDGNAKEARGYGTLGRVLWVELLCCTGSICQRERQTVAACSPKKEETMMRGIIRCLAAGALAGLVLLAPVAQGDEKDKAKAKAEKVPVDKVPKKVMDTVNARLPGAKLTSVEKETEDGAGVYDIELTHEGRKYEMDIKEDGTLIEIEKEVLAKDVPEAVTKALKGKYPGSTIEVVMEVNKVKGKEETPDHYEVTLETAAKKKIEVVVSLDGKSVKSEAEEKAKK
jgi:uncharacterized membrane protein YkoI